jgi:hypothetical protein
MMASGLKSVVAITAVNLNPRYLDCVPYFVEFWLSHESSSGAFAYEPRIIVIAERLPDLLYPYRKWCVVHSPEPDIPSTFASQNIRLFWPGLEDSDYVLTTDIDMLPLGDTLFHRALSALESGQDFVVCRDVLPEGQYPMCYNIASPRTWRLLTGIGDESDAAARLNALFSKSDPEGAYTGEHGGIGWFKDQQTLFSLVMSFEARGGSVVRLRDCDTRHRRLDRRLLPSFLSWLALPFANYGFFTDYHIHHPVKRHQRFIDGLLAGVRRRKKAKVKFLFK